MAKSKKNKRKSSTCYREEDVDKALNAIQEGMPKLKASRLFGVPRSTLQFRLSTNFTKTSKGPTPYLTSDEENILVLWIGECVQEGFPRNKDDIFLTVKEFFDKSGRKNPFKDNLPGRTWYKKFLQRHPEIVNRTPESVSSASGNVSEENIRKWFDTIESYLNSKDFFEILQDPTRILNGDETGFQLCPKQKTVLAPKGCKNVYQIDSGQAKSSLTVMFTFSASGVTTPPMIIYPLKRMSSKIQKTVPNEYGIGLSDNGWMKAELFFEYISNILYPFLIKTNVTFPVILFVDGHKTHLTYQLSCLCTSLNIILIALYPNATRILQPADVSAFRPIKSGWKNALQKWRRDHPLEQITKENFAPILDTIVKDIKPENIINGFRACGLFPWNKDAIDYSKCLGKNTGQKKNQQPSFACDTHLSYNAFCEILGPGKIDEIQNLINEPKDENLLCLYKIYKEFLPHNVQRDLSICNNNEKVTDNNVEGIYNIEDIPIVFADDLQNMSTNSLPTISINDTPQNPGFDQNEKQIILHDSFQMEINKKVEEPGITENDVVEQLTEIINNGSQNDHSVEQSEEIQNVHYSPNKKEQKINILQIIHWPATPQRKGRQLSEKEKLPYVVTSTGWKEIQEKKIREKEQKEAEKEERKRKRLVNKKEKEQPAKKRKVTPKKNVKPRHVRKVFQDGDVNNNSDEKTDNAVKKSDIYINNAVDDSEVTNNVEI